MREKYCPTHIVAHLKTMFDRKTKWKILIYTQHLKKKCNYTITNKQAKEKK